MEWALHAPVGAGLRRIVSATPLAFAECILCHAEVRAAEGVLVEEESIEVDSEMRLSRAGPGLPASSITNGAKRQPLKWAMEDQSFSLMVGQHDWRDRQQRRTDGGGRAECKPWCAHHISCAFGIEGR